MRRFLGCKAVCRLGLAVWLGMASAALAASPAEWWPTQVPKSIDPKKLDAAATTLPPELAPAVKFEQAFLRAVARAPENDWLPAMQTLASATGNDPVSAETREVAKAWVARAQMAQIGEVLDKDYVENVRYPSTFAEVEKTLPPDLKADPWGEPWTYQPRAPQGFAQEVNQRYQLGPKRFPNLGTLREATSNRKPLAPPAWKIFLRTTGNNRALEFQQNGAVAGLLTAGGKIGDYGLLYVGDHWALMAATDQLFTVAF